ncbi:MAG: response regulator transcription factor [Myxococcales bacterium]|nr:response regulator transcription factor [Myxococcales bacterium]
MRLLVVDDHPEVQDLVSSALARDGHHVVGASTRREAQDLLAATTVDLVVLDVGLPDGSGVDLCRQLRGQGFHAPILLLTAHSAVDRRVDGLDAGADDFLGKPFAVAELRARVRALGRRGAMPKPLRVERGPVSLDFLGRRASLSGVEVPLTTREWSVLDLLATRGGRTVARAEILEIVWGDATEGAASLEVLVARIRKKLGDGLIRTLRGYGYALGSP